MFRLVKWKEVPRFGKAASLQTFGDSERSRKPCCRSGSLYCLARGFHKVIVTCWFALKTGKLMMIAQYVTVLRTWDEGWLGNPFLDWANNINYRWNKQFSFSLRQFWHFPFSPALFYKTRLSSAYFIFSLAYLCFMKPHCRQRCFSCCFHHHRW